MTNRDRAVLMLVLCSLVLAVLIYPWARIGVASLYCDAYIQGGAPWRTEKDYWCGSALQSSDLSWSGGGSARVRETPFDMCVTWRDDSPAAWVPCKETK